MTRPKLDRAALDLPATLPADLLARRADIAAAKARIAAAFQGREIARKAYYPDINLIALAGSAALGAGAAVLRRIGGAIWRGRGDPPADLRRRRTGRRLAGATAQLDEAVADYNQSVVTAVKQTAGSR
ncbi:MAG: hypothetical protein WDN03_06525 [Rhizomicrobium sp.]